MSKEARDAMLEPSTGPSTSHSLWGTLVPQGPPGRLALPSPGTSVGECDTRTDFNMTWRGPGDQPGSEAIPNSLNLRKDEG